MQNLCMLGPGEGTASATSLKVLDFQQSACRFQATSPMMTTCTQGKERSHKDGHHRVGTNMSLIYWLLQVSQTVSAEAQCFSGTPSLSMSSERFLGDPQKPVGCLESRSSVQSHSIRSTMVTNSQTVWHTKSGCTLWALTARVEVRPHSITLTARCKSVTYRATGMQALGLLVTNTLPVEAHTST